MRFFCFFLILRVELAAIWPFFTGRVSFHLHSVPFGQAADSCVLLVDHCVEHCPGKTTVRLWS